MAALFAGVAMATPAAAITLATPTNGGNGNGGIMFDIVVGPNALTLTEIGLKIEPGPNNFEFYTITGGIGSNGSNAAAWTLRDSFANVSGPGPLYNQPGGVAQFDITDLVLMANTTYGLYLTVTIPEQFPGTPVGYTNLPLGNVVASDSNLSIQSGFGKFYPFGGNFPGRAFNGSLTYRVNAIPEPASWAMLIAGFGLTGAAARRRRARTA
jgi:hypothetical protein